MKRFWVRKWVWLGVLALSGCTTCASPYDCDYPAFGGKVERIDRKHGRVNSIFSAPMAGSTLVDAAASEPVYIDGEMIDAPMQLDWDLEGTPAQPSLPSVPRPAQPIDSDAATEAQNEQASVLLDLAPSGGRIHVGSEAEADFEMEAEADDTSESPSDDETYEEEFFELSLSAP